MLSKPSRTVRGTAASLAAALGLAFAASGVSAQTATPRADTRQAVQEKRVQKGVDSGTLTTTEANRMERQQGAVDKLEDHAKADGTVTAAERARLHRAQKRTSHNIHQQKHDRQTTP